MTRPQRPWQISRFESGAAKAGIVFERNDLVSLGNALLACGPNAACIIVSNETADRLTPNDDSALWSAIARRGTNSSESVIVHLPTFGGNASLEVGQVPHATHPLGGYATIRATTYVPADAERTESNIQFFDDSAEHLVFLNDTGNYLSSRRQYDGYYKRFIEEHVPRIHWLNEVRARLIKELIRNVVWDGNEPPGPPFRPKRFGWSAVVLNERGGRVATVASGVGIPPNNDMLLVANEFDRPAAIRALAQSGLELPFDPVTGWLNASVRPSRHAWVFVRWSGEVEGRRVQLELARLRSRSGRLTVFAAELAEPIELLLRRAGLPPLEISIQHHPDDPECLFGVDLFEQQTPPVHRKLRPEVRKLIPAEWAEQLEAAWCPAAPPLKARTSPPTHEERRMQINEQESAAEYGECRFCDGPGNLNRFTPRFPADGCCRDCQRNASWGSFSDDGFDAPWSGAVVWALKTLAKLEFGGAPSAQQLSTPPTGPHADLLILCRMLTARSSDSALGAERRTYAWTDWLAQAGLLATGVRTTRGTTVVAKDGHMCRSLLERVIDDFFFDHGIAHEIEPAYPYDPELNRNGSLADWKLHDGTFVEALGFPNRTDYMAKAERKIRLADGHKIPLVTLTENDLNRLEKIFERWLPPTNAQPQR